MSEIKVPNKSLSHELNNRLMHILAVTMPFKPKPPKPSNTVDKACETCLLVEIHNKLYFGSIGWVHVVKDWFEELSSSKINI